MAETTHLTVIIAGRSYPLIVEKAEEQDVLHAVKTINERIVELQAQFQSKDKQDCLAMILLQMALEKKSSARPDENHDLQQVQKSLSELESMLDELLA